jgi:Amt family ammonium transporter
MSRAWRIGVGFLLLATVVAPATAQTPDTAASLANADQLQQGLNTVWVMLAAFLVFFMQAGFALVEAGFVRAKNACNILMKNYLDFFVAALAFFLVGFALMFGRSNGFCGLDGWCLLDLSADGPSGLPLLAFWMFQATFCGAAATIVSGGMAERMRFAAYLGYSFLISAFVYPVVGHWIWGGGWLAGMGFADFAGSTVVHTVGGVAALVGTAILGPRDGKYGIDGKPNVLAGHSIPLAALGVFILWFGWYGFNAGSTLGVADGSLIARIGVNTTLAAALGGLASMLTVWKRFGKPDLSMTMNGALAGLVAITAPCAFVDPWAALVIGLLAGYAVVRGVELLERLRIDDPVGAFPVHGICGVLGTLCVGIFGRQELGLASDGLVYGGNPLQLGVQFVGVVATVAFTAVCMTVVFKLIDVTIGLRVSREEELQGLDIGEHGMEAYDGFQIFTIR